MAPAGGGGSDEGDLGEPVDYVRGEDGIYRPTVPKNNQIQKYQTVNGEQQLVKKSIEAGAYYEDPKKPGNFWELSTKNTWNENQDSPWTLEHTKKYKNPWDKVYKYNNLTQTWMTEEDAATYKSQNPGKRQKDPVGEAQSLNLQPKYTATKVNASTIAGTGKTTRNKDRPKPKAKIRSEYDLLFNSLDYAVAYDAELQQMAMDLIFAGDDILDNFNYQSIDYLPDYEIEMKRNLGDYDFAHSILKKQGFLTEITKEPDEQEPEVKASEDLNLLNKLARQIELKINSKKYNERIAFFGLFDSDNDESHFTSGVSKSGSIDFKFNLTDDDYENLDNLQIHFDPI